jgi:hypothetical protein
MRKILPPLPSSSLSSSSSPSRPSPVPSLSASRTRRPSTSSGTSPSSSGRGIRFPPQSLLPPSSASSSSRKKSPKQQNEKEFVQESKLPSICQPPTLLLENYKIFWRIHKTALVSIYYHSDSDFFEVITYFTQEEYEGLHLYVSMNSIIPILENSSEMRLMKLLRWDLLDRSLKKCAAEYLYGILDSDADGALHLTRYDGELWTLVSVSCHDQLVGRDNILLDLRATQPSNLIPVVVERSPTM